MKNKFLVFSLVLNFVVIFYCAFLQKKINKYEQRSEIDNTHGNLSIQHNFKKVFVEKSDSVYKIIFGTSFENNPVEAYLIASSYYLLTKNPAIKKDIMMVNTELQPIYGTVPEIDTISK
jgi:hypothetical protein